LTSLFDCMGRFWRQHFISVLAASVLDTVDALLLESILI